MTVIVCIGDGRGTTFFGRRLTTDSKIRSMILSFANEGKTVMNAYTASQFKDSSDKIDVTEDVFSRGKGSVCLVEDVDPAPQAELIDTLVIYRWNRKYPVDRPFGIYPFEEGMVLESIRDVAGSSHERVTEEIWKKASKGDGSYEREQRKRRH